MRVLLAILVLASAPDGASAKCAMPDTGSVVLTPDGATLAPDGGVVIGAATSFEVKLAGAEDGKNPAWRFADDKAQHAPELVVLAPGLVVHRPPVGIGGELTLADGKKPVVTIDRGKDAVAVLEAPNVVSVAHVTKPVRYRGTYQTLHATFKAAAPAGAVAVIVFGVTAKGNVARSWSRVEANALTEQVAGTSGRCDVGIPGEIMSKIGDKVVLAWVDASGRLSKLSKPVVVKKGTP